MLVCQPLAMGRALYPPGGQDERRHLQGDPPHP